MNNLIRISLLLVVVLLSACQDKPADKRHHSILKFGTQIDIEILGVDDRLAEQAFADLQRDFDYWHEAWNPWLAGPLSRVNSLIPTQAEFSLPLHLIPLIQRSQWLYQQSDGLYNPAIGNLINLWRFHEYQDPDKKPPSDDEITALVAQHPAMTDLKLDGIRLRSDNAAVQLNFGAFAKGYAIELSMQTLRDLGIENAIINAGGDLKAIGRHKDRPWRIGIRHPRQAGVIASLSAGNNESVFTSGDYERYFIYEGRRYHHILDPRTGYPAVLSQSVTVIDKDAGLADAAATALFIAGPEHWHRIAKQMGIHYVMLVDAEGQIHMNPAMAERIQIEVEPRPTVIISPPL